MERGRIPRLGGRIGFAIPGQQRSERFACLGPGAKLRTSALTQSEVSGLAARYAEANQEKRKPA